MQHQNKDKEIFKCLDYLLDGNQTPVSRGYVDKLRQKEETMNVVNISTFQTTAVVSVWFFVKPSCHCSDVHVTPALVSR